LSNLTKDRDECRPAKDTDKEPHNYSRCQQRKLVHKETTFKGNYKTNIEIAKHSSMEHNSAINGDCRNRQAHTKNSTHRIPVLVNGLTSMDVSTKNNLHEPKSNSQQNREHKIIITGDSHARGVASNVRPGAKIYRLISSMPEGIKHIMCNDIMVFWGGTNDVSKNNSQDALKHITNFVKANSHTNIS